MKEYDRQTLLRVAKQSPEAVGNHDKKAWVSLFARTSIIEDPVGSRPHVSGIFDPKTGNSGMGRIARFYETFIEPNEITFHVERDIVADETVVRDLEIEIQMSPEVRVRVPMHVFYRLTEEEGELRIFRLAAHWEFLPMIKRVLSHGWPGIRAVGRLGMIMMQKQGLGGALGFSRAAFGISKQGVERVQDFVLAVHAKNDARLRQLFHSPTSSIAFPVGGSTYLPATFLEAGEVTLEVSKLISAGYVTTFSFSAEVNGNRHYGVGRFEFNAKSRRIENVRFYWDDDGV